MQESTMKLKFGKNDFVLETGKIAKQANGAVTIQYGGTVVLVTACMSKELREGQDFFPLTVEYQEKTYAAGRIPGGFFKREGRPSESEILTARLIDRPVRPLFPKGFLNEVQIMALVLSSDGENDPDVLAVCGASAALSISDIPFNGPLACCRVARVNEEFIINPTYAELEIADLDVVLAINNKGVEMLESKAKEVSEEDYMQAVKVGFEALQELLRLQEEFKAKFGKPKAKIEYKVISPALKKQVEDLAAGKLKEIYNISNKDAREEQVDLLCKELKEKLVCDECTAGDIKTALVEVEQLQVRKKILEDNQRVDGRSFKDIRPISCEVSVLPRTHGSSLFTRGQTQSLAVTTLGTGQDEQMVEALEVQKFKTFKLQYSFPPLSVG